MPSYSEIRAQFEAGSLGWSETLQAIDGLPAHWHTKEWAERREQVIGTVCATCGTSEPPMVLQHVWHPASFQELCERVKEPLRLGYAQEHPFHFGQSEFRAEDVPFVQEERDACPKCGSVSVKHRKSTNDWICNGTSGGVRRKRFCHYVFLEPVRRLHSRYSHEEQIQLAQTQHKWAATKALTK